MLELKNIDYEYKNNDNQILVDVNYIFNTGTFYTILGPSGSGKTTLLSLLGGLDYPTSGSLFLENQEFKKIGHSNLRRHHISFVFQSYNLLNYLTAIENVVLPMDIAKINNGKKADIAKKFLNELGLNEHEMNRKVKHLSGGQQQRVCIARALSCDANYILADEPTGNLDRKTAEGIITIFKDLAHERNKCIIMVTHDHEIIKQSDITLSLYDGKLILNQERINL
jgi:ABC-type antimicrobial peptide transport system, ATPase component